jgi:hypothetical protein
VWFCANHLPDRATTPLSVLTVPARLNGAIPERTIWICQRKAEICTTHRLHTHVDNIINKSRSCTLVSFLHFSIKLPQNLALGLWV